MAYFLENVRNSRLVQNFSKTRGEVDYFEELTFLLYDSGYEVLRLKWRMSKSQFSMQTLDLLNLPLLCHH